MSMMNRKKIIIWAVITGMVLLFIWGNSMLPPDVSDGLSKWVTGILGFNRPGEQTDSMNHIVRKLAHYSEYFALGIVLWLALCGKIKPFLRGIVLQGFCGLLTAVIDETIQLFSQRGPSLTDVWLDYAGFLCGSLLALLICHIRAKQAEKKSEKETAES